MIVFPLVTLLLVIFGLICLDIIAKWSVYDMVGQGLGPFYLDSIEQTTPTHLTRTRTVKRTIPKFGLTRTRQTIPKFGLTRTRQTTPKIGRTHLTRTKSVGQTNHTVGSTSPQTQIQTQTQTAPQTQTQTQTAPQTQIQTQTAPGAGLSTKSNKCDPVIAHQGLVPVSDRGLTEAEQQSIVTAHNEYRAIHGVKPLTYDSVLGKDAQKWADVLAGKGCKLEHDPNSEQGENLAYSAGKDSNTVDPVKNWYSERCDYEKMGNYGQVPDSSGPAVGHFTQMIWKGTERAGCGFAKCPGKQDVWVCRYEPAGNMVVAKVGETMLQAKARTYQEQLTAPI